MKNTKAEPAWLDVPGCAEYAGVAESTVRWWIRTRVIPVHKPGGKLRSHIRIARSDVDALLSASRVEATSGPLAGGGPR